MSRTTIWAVAFAIASGGAFAQPAAPAPTDGRLYELRTYHAAPGKLDALHDRFRDHTRRLMERHGITCHGFWAPGNEAADRVVALVSYPSAAARTASWAGFATDQEWLRVKRSTERQGRLVEQITDIKLAGSLCPTAADPAGRRVFEVKLVRRGESAESSGERVGSWVPVGGAGEIVRVVLIARPKVTARGQAPDLRSAAAFVSAAIAPTDRSNRLLLPTDYSPIR